MNKVIMILLLGIMSLSIISCARGVRVDRGPINRNVAILIAAAGVPANVIGKASAVTQWDDSKWTVHFLLSYGATVTKSEINWPESPNNTFVNHRLPAGSYSLLSFGIDRKTGDVLFREASDSVLLGGIDTWNTEPPEQVFMPLWSVMLIGVVGLVIGGMAVGFIMRRKKMAA